MPSLNSRTKQLNYSKADYAILADAIPLLKQMSDSDDTARDFADEALHWVRCLLVHIENERRHRREQLRSPSEAGAG